MIDEILITGAKLRENGFELGEGKYYCAAKLLKLNLKNGAIYELLEIDSGNDNCPDVHPNLEFTIGDVDGSDLWLSMDTEIRLYTYPELELKRTFSHPCFHNVHSVAVRGGSLYVTSTGLDLVVVLDKESGNIVNMINAEGKEVWHRFSPDIDYRKLHSTRPHECHPNFIFWLDDVPWVTRCTQEDAVCLADFTKVIDISGADKSISVHDGIVVGDLVYFTSVDGCIVIADSNSLKVIETIDLSKYDGYGGVRGWCRGLYINEGLLYIGFSVLRKTKAIHKIKWIKKFIGKEGFHKESSVLIFDLKNRKIVGDYKIDIGSLDAIYSILPCP